MMQARKPLPEKVSIEPVTPTHLPAYRRLITLLLPIRYPDKFYQDSVAISGPSSLALCALWHEPAKPASNIVRPYPSSDRVVAGIQCCLESLPSATAPCKPGKTLYIQTLATLAPYRSFGIASALLDITIRTSITHYEDVEEVYAHVWEANEEALEWYAKRGFVVEEQVVEEYYRKLSPSGARLVRRRVGVGDHLRAKAGVVVEEEAEDMGTNAGIRIGESKNG
ncbi:hypothetical protein P7C71_g1961, partial [Lecanoromycetidae sp. Uapishka_2]